MPAASLASIPPFSYVFRNGANGRIMACNFRTYAGIRSDPDDEPAQTMGTILLIADRAGERESLASALRGAGHGVIEAADGDQGLQVLRIQNADAVVADLAA